MSQLKPQHRYIQPGDYDQKVDIIFNMAELKKIQNTLLRGMERVANEENAVYGNQRQLAMKLEYFIMNNETVIS